MANIKSSKKDIKQIAKKTPVNNEYKKRVSNSIKKCEKAIIANDYDKALLELKNVQKNIDKAYSKKLINKNNANRQKSRLSQKVKSMK